MPVWLRDDSSQTQAFEVDAGQRHGGHFYTLAKGDLTGEGGTSLGGEEYTLAYMMNLKYELMCIICCQVILDVAMILQHVLNWMIHTHDALTFLSRWSSCVQRTYLSSQSHIEFERGSGDSRVVMSLFFYTVTVAVIGEDGYAPRLLPPDTSVQAKSEQKLICWRAQRAPRRSMIPAFRGTTSTLRVTVYQHLCHRRVRCGSTGKRFKGNIAGVPCCTYHTPYYSPLNYHAMAPQKGLPLDRPNLAQRQGRRQVGMLLSELGIQLVFQHPWFHEEKHRANLNSTRHRPERARY